MTHTQDNWEVRFDKEFALYGYEALDFPEYVDGTHRLLTTKEKTINFISREIQQAKKEERERIEEIINSKRFIVKTPFLKSEQAIVDATLDDIINLINKQ